MMLQISDLLLLALSFCSRLVFIYCLCFVSSALCVFCFACCGACGCQKIGLDALPR